MTGNLQIMRIIVLESNSIANARKPVLGDEEHRQRSNIQVLRVTSSCHPDICMGRFSRKM